MLRHRSCWTRSRKCTYPMIQTGRMRLMTKQKGSIHTWATAAGICSTLLHSLRSLLLCGIASVHLEQALAPYIPPPSIPFRLSVPAEIFLSFSFFFCSPRLGSTSFQMVAGWDGHVSCVCVRVSGRASWCARKRASAKVFVLYASAHRRRLDRLSAICDSHMPSIHTITSELSEKCMWWSSGFVFAAEPGACECACEWTKHPTATPTVIVRRPASTGPFAPVRLSVLRRLSERTGDAALNVRRRITCGEHSSPLAGGCRAEQDGLRGGRLPIEGARAPSR